MGVGHAAIDRGGARQSCEGTAPALSHLYIFCIYICVTRPFCFAHSALAQTTLLSDNPLAIKLSRVCAA